MKINSYAKINLSLDVGSVMPNGMHPVDMIMQTVSLCDEVVISMNRDGSNGEVSLSCNNPEIPLDERNLAYKAARLMLDKAAMLMPDKVSQIKDAGIHIHLEKRVPMAAGLAGGSGNGAAVILGLNSMLNLNLPLEELCELAAKLGSDVPFSLLGQAKLNDNLQEYLRTPEATDEVNSTRATTAARATGTGTILKPCKALRTYVVLAKPEIGVSTGAVYRGIDSCEIPERPDNDLFEEALNNQGSSPYDAETLATIKDNMINVLENYTLKAAPEVGCLKSKMIEALVEAPPQEEKAIKVLMSGSGPTVYALFEGKEAAEKAEKKLREILGESHEVHLCQTL